MRGLQFLHDNGFVHSDIKPTNIGLVNVYPETVTFDVSFLDSVQQRPLKAFLLDVDSTIPLSPGSRLAASPGRGGTVSYLSPERENVGIDHTEDVWALGVSACRVIFGTHPFRDAQGNPWRHEAPSLDTRRKTFHEQYENILDQIANYSLISGSY